MRTLLLLLSLTLCSCLPSMIYDPSLHMPARPLEAADVQLAGGVVYALETRPDSVGHAGVLGGTTLVRAGLGEDVSVGARYWFTYATTTSGGVQYRGGISGDVALDVGHIADSVTLALVGRAGSVFGSNFFGGVGIEGGGVAMQAMARSQLGESTALTVAAGSLFGFRDLSNSRPQWGVGGLANVGLSWRIVDRFDVIGEVVGLLYHDAHSGELNAAASPSLVLSYTF